MSDTFRCDFCGRFAVPYDDYTDFGDASMSEPPDPVVFCRQCSEWEEERYVENGRIPSHWRKSRADIAAAKRLGLVEAGPCMAAWSQWFTPKDVPEDWKIWRRECVSRA